MNILIKTMIVLPVMTMISGCASMNRYPDLDENANIMISKLSEAAAAGKFLYAHQDDIVYGHSWKAEDIAGDSLLRSDVKSVCGSFPAIVGFDLGGIELGDSANLDGVPFELMRRSALTHTSRGGFVTFSWHPRNPLTGGDAWDISSDQVVTSVLEGGDLHEEFMLWLTRAADFLESLKDADGEFIPVIFRPWHENVGSWFWWGGKLCTPEQYKALFRQTRDYLAGTRGLKNIVWAYSPDSGADSTEYFERYPGDDYVEILGIDHYEYVDRSDGDPGEEVIAEANEFYKKRLDRDLRYMEAYAASHGKLIAVSETGFEGTPYSQWWTGVLLPAAKDYPICYLLTWRNAWDKPGHFFAPFPGSGDEKDFEAFCGSGRAIFLNVND